MALIVKKHRLGLAIITWMLDPYPQRQEDDLGLDYCIDLAVYDIECNLIKEDAIGCVQVCTPMDDLKEFEKEILEICEYHFEELMK